MKSKLNIEAFANLIRQDIEELEKYMPKNSLEKIHIKEVLLESLSLLYSVQGSEHKIDLNLTEEDIKREAHKYATKQSAFGYSYENAFDNYKLSIQHFLSLYPIKK